MKLSKKTLIIALVLLVLASAGIYFLTQRTTTPKATYTTAKAEIATISTSITATGTIEPVTMVEVGTQVSGIISKIYVDYNSVVKKGQVIAELDRTNLISELSSVKSQLASAKSDLDYQRLNYNRQKSLHDKGHISDNDFETARLAFEQAQSAYNSRLEAVRKAQTNLGYATITSPIDGVVLNKAVEEGQTVAASFSTPTLFTIARDLTDMRVIAKVDEADIGSVRQGQRVTFTVDAYPEDTFEGKVTQVRQEATTESNVVTYQVVISAPNPDLKLLPGLTANVVIVTAEKKGAVSVPAAALRFTPNELLISEDESIQDVEGKNKVWVKEGKVFKAIAVQVGVTNGTQTEVSGLRAGQEVITEFMLTGNDASEDAQTTNPFMPNRKQQNKK